MAMVRIYNNTCNGGGGCVCVSPIMVLGTGAVSTERCGAFNSASGDYSMAWGKCTTASCTFSTASGYCTTASAYHSTASGRSTTASGSYSTASGYRTTASGYFSTASGYCAIASGNNSTASGMNTTASGNYSTASGLYSCASQYGQRSWANGSFSRSVPDAQQVQYVLRQSTALASTPLNMYLDGSSQEISIKPNSAMLLNVLTLGIEQDGTPVASSQDYVVIKNVAGTTTLPHVSTIASHYGAVGLAVTITANNTNDTLQIQVTGTNNPMRWVSYVYGVEILYAT